MANRMTPSMRRTGWWQEGSGLAYYGKHIFFVVHPHIDAPGKWFVTCYLLSVINRELRDAETLEQAKSAAAAVLRKRLEEYAADIGNVTGADA